MSGWTIDTLKEHLESRITAADENVRLALAAADRAVTKAETATEKRFDGVNEFRGMLNDITTRLMPRAEYEVQHKALSDRVTLNAEVLTRLEAKGVGRGEGLGSVATVLLVSMTGIAAICAVAALVVSLVK